MTVDGHRSSSGTLCVTCSAAKPILSLERGVCWFGTRKGRPSYVTSAGSGAFVGQPHPARLPAPWQTPQPGAKTPGPIFGRALPVTVAIVGSTSALDPRMNGLEANARERPRLYQTRGHGGRTNRRPRPTARGRHETAWFHHQSPRKSAPSEEACGSSSVSGGSVLRAHAGTE